VQRAQVNAFVPELLEIHRTPRLDQRHDTAQVLRAVEANSSIDSAIVHITREVATGVETTTDDELLPFRVKSSVLQVRVVLVRPESVHLVVRDALAEHVACGSGALRNGVVPVLHSHLPIEDWMIVIRDVTGGINTADVGAAVLVNDNPVVQLNTAVSQRLDGWLDASSMGRWRPRSGLLAGARRRLPSR